ncbi:MAG: hypothetical protein K6A62_06680 [Bacteroidales bacterium]|nr:hypothetical protein [Bacteroidales bacterium]
MNKEEIDINQELEQMRQDYADLKVRFDKQQILNEKLMKKAFKSDIGWLSLDRGATLVAGAFTILSLISFSIWRGLPWRYSIPLCAVCIIAVLAILWVYKNLSLDTLFGEDILTATKKVRRFKQQYLRGTILCWVAVLGILGVFSPVVYRIWSPSGKAVSVFVMMGVLLVILAIIGVFGFMRLMQACDKILERLQMKEDGDLKQ